MESLGKETAGDGTGNGDGPALTREAIFETLRSRRRRHALHYLRRVEGAVAIRELSRQLAAWELGKETGAVTPKERKRLYTALHQTHLPKMDRLGVVAYDRDRGTVAPTSAGAEVDVYLDVVGREELSWGQFYLGLGVVATALVAAAALGVSPFDGVGGFGYAIAVAVAVTLAAAVHTVRDRRTGLGVRETPPDAVPPETDPPR
jgi:hypothetical protein